MSRLLIDMPSGEYWASDSVQPDVRSVVDVLYHVYGKPAYFRGTVRRRQNTEQGLALTIAFKRQTHYKLAFPVSRSVGLPSEPPLSSPPPVSSTCSSKCSGIATIWRWARGFAAWCVCRAVRADRRVAGIQGRGGHLEPRTVALRVCVRACHSTLRSA